MEKTYTTQFITPCNVLISGASNSGKSEWVFRLIQNASTMIYPNVDLIYYCYKEFSERFNDIKGVSFFEGFDESIISKENLQSRSVLLILDDLLGDLDSKLLSDLFLVYSHHRKIMPCVITHSLFYPGLKCRKLIMDSTTYNIIMKNNRDKASVRCFASQVFPGQTKWFMEAYNYATKDSYSYLLVDSKNTQADELRLRTRVFPGEDQICFIPNIKGR